MKKWLRPTFTFIGIAALFPLASIGWTIFSQTNLYLNIFGVRDGAGTVIAYLDKNADGVREASEPPLEGVCILSGYRPDPPGVIKESQPCRFEGSEVTDEQGRWDMFLPGGECDMLYVFAVAPPGFHSTNTPASKACSAQFGFVQENVQPLQSFPTMEQFARRASVAEAVKQVAIVLVVFATAGLGTWWLNKPVKPRVEAN